MADHITLLEDFDAGSEHGEQCRIYDWVKQHEAEHPELALFYAIPNGARLSYRKSKNGKRYSPEAQKLLAEGMRPGVPDMCLPVARDNWHGLYIELKRGKNKPSEKQVEYLERLTRQGYLAVVCYGSKDAIDTIKKYLGIME
jgi:hypothetical protein